NIPIQFQKGCNKPILFSLHGLLAVINVYTYVLLFFQPKKLCQLFCSFLSQLKCISGCFSIGLIIYINPITNKYTHFCMAKPYCRNKINKHYKDQNCNQAN